MTTHADPLNESSGAGTLERPPSGKIICNACPVLCQISEGRTGACDRWGNFNGKLTWDISGEHKVALSYHGSWKQWSPFEWA